MARLMDQQLARQEFVDGAERCCRRGELVFQREEPGQPCVIQRWRIALYAGQRGCAGGNGGCTVDITPVAVNPAIDGAESTHLILLGQQQNRQNTAT